jgi:ribosomal protein L1
MVRSSVVLPNGTGKEIRVLVFGYDGHCRQDRPHPRTAESDAKRQARHGYL